MMAEDTTSIRADEDEGSFYLLWCVSSRQMSNPGAEHQ